MTRIQKRRRKCSQYNASASAMNSRPASEENATATAIDSRPVSQGNATATAMDSRPASQENATATAMDSITASEENVAASSMDSRSALPENASAPPLDSRPISSFEFSVTSEEGISLYVDMNSSLIDWHKRMENGMCICRCLEENKSQSFREQLLYLGNNNKQTEDSVGWKSDGRVKDGNSRFVSSHSLLNYPDAKNGPLDIFAAEACSFAMEDFECLKEQKEEPFSISSNLGVEGMISSPGPENIESKGPNAFRVPQGKIASCSMESLATDGPKTRLNDKKVKIKMGWDTQNVPLPVSSVSAIESKLSEVNHLENDPACSSFVNDTSLNLIDAAQSMETGIEKLAKSIENEHHIDLNILSAEDQASGSPVHGTEASWKLEVVSDGEQIKRKRTKSLLDKVSLQFSGRILRSAMRPRRSLRLVSKVVTP